MNKKFIIALKGENINFIIADIMPYPIQKKKCMIYINIYPITE